MTREEFNQTARLRYAQICTRLLVVDDVQERVYLEILKREYENYLRMWGGGMKHIILECELCEQEYGCKTRHHQFFCHECSCREECIRFGFISKTETKQVGLCPGCAKDPLRGNHA